MLFMENTFFCFFYRFIIFQPIVCLLCHVFGTSIDEMNVVCVQRLADMKVQDIPIHDGNKQFDVVDKGDVVILPAFGAALNEMLTLNEKSVQIVDTTCPWVSKVSLYSQRSIIFCSRNLIARMSAKLFVIFSC